MQKGWHCSEGILLAAGKYYLPEKIPQILPYANPFSGGVGGTQEQMCGAFSGGLILIGALHGRSELIEDDEECQCFAKEFRTRFLDHFGYLICKDLRAHWVGKPGREDCADLTAYAVEILIDTLEK